MKVKNIQAVLYDLDGTLVDSLGDFHHAANLMLQKMGWDSLTAETVRGFIGNGQKAFVTRCITASTSMVTAEMFTEADQIFTEQYDAISGQFSAPYPGVVSFVASRKKMRQRQAICTNRPEARAREILSQTGLVDYFDVIIGFESTAKPKPSPEPLLKALNVLGAPPDNTIYIGDSAVDAEAAQAAEVSFLFHEAGYGELLASTVPARRFSDYSELTTSFCEPGEKF